MHLSTFPSPFLLKKSTMRFWFCFASVKYQHSILKREMGNEGVTWNPWSSLQTFTPRSTPHSQSLLHLRGLRVDTGQSLQDTLLSVAPSLVKS